MRPARALPRPVRWRLPAKHWWLLPARSPPRPARCQWQPPPRPGRCPGPCRGRPKVLPVCCCP
ncbi:MAG TPA: hypothetical protein DHV46_01195 [Desulfovibrio piger]|nr:hypothetical protein [Desulfovibrio piger]